MSYAPEFDDKRGAVHWVKSYKEFVEWIQDHGLPTKICFDNDLGPNQKEGKDCAKWLIEYCLDNELPLPEYRVQSANTPAREYISGLLASFNKSSGL